MKKKIFFAFVFLLILIPILFISLRKDNILTWEQANAQLATPNSYYFDWDEHTFHYTKIGNGSIPVVMIHGFGGSHKNFESFSLVVDSLSNDYTLYAIDLPAFGLSQVPDLSINNDSILTYYRNYLDAVVTVLEIDSFHILGNSMGGWMAWDYVGRNPDKVWSLSLLNSAGFGMEDAKKNATSWMTSPLGKWIFKKGVPLKMNFSNAKKSRWDDGALNENKVEANYIMMNKEGTFEWMMKMAQSNINPDTLLLQQITSPTWVVWGKEDEIVNVKYVSHFKHNIPHAQTTIYDQCGHVPQIEYPVQFAMDWLAFVTN